MPRVPTYDSFQASPTILQPERFSAPEALDTAGQQAKQIGQGLSQAGDAMARIAYEKQNEANQLRVDDALNQVKEQALRLTYDKDEGFTNQRGIQALQRDSGKPLADEYTDTLREQVSKVADGLSSPDQKRLFGVKVNDLVTSFQGQALKHESDQFREYSMSVREGTIKNAVNDIGLNYNNPESVDQSITSIRAAVSEQAKLLGKSATWAEAQAKVATSNAHTVAISAALEKNDVTYADAYLKKYAGQMEADDILKVQGHITREMDARVAQQAATHAVASAVPRLVTSDVDRAFNILVGTESGGKQFGKDGQPLTSEKGAVGLAQVMPTTAPEAARLANVVWDEARYKSDKDYNRALGKAYFAQQLKDFDGNLAYAFAAYNAGPGRTREAIKLSGEGLRTGSDWMAYLPKETQDYVRKNMQAYQAGDGAFQKPTLLEVHAAVRNDPAVASNPQRLKLAIEEATKQYDDYGKAVKQREDEAVAEAQRQILANGGDFKALPASVRTALPPGKVDDILTFAGKISKGEPIHTDWALYYQLRSDPAVLGQVNLMAVRSRLGDEEFKALTTAQESLRKDGGLTEVRSFKDTLGQFMREAGIDPTPKDTDKSGSEKVGQVWGEFEKRVRDAEQAKGSKLNNEEMNKVAARMFTRVGVNGTFWNSEKPAYQVQTGDKLAVPSADRAQIVAALKKAGRPADDASILAVYRKAKGL